MSFRWNCFPCLKPEEEDIRRLDYQHFMLNDLPPEVFAYERTLEELMLDSNHIRDLPRPLFHCHGLKHLSLSDNDVQSLPPAIASLINLQHLDISRNALAGIPDNIKGCKHLMYIDVSVNPLEKLPEGFTQLIALEELYLNDTYLEFLPANFGRLTKLRILELRENNLNTLPKSIGRLINLERLDIGQNEFSDFPEVIGNLGNLKELWADCNRIKSIPKFIGNLKKLIHFDASNNNIVWMSHHIGKCQKLTDLCLSSNELPEIPQGIGYLKDLVTLKLDENHLSDLPCTLGQLSKLEELVLSQNYFIKLPPCIGLLRSLHLLNADQNFLEELPSEIGSCTSLTILSLRMNKLQEVPAELGHLPNIKVINLAENLLHCLPVSLLNLTQLTALWLSNNQSTPLTTLQQEIDKETGQTVCVNFMLPQSAAPVEMNLEVPKVSRQGVKSGSRLHIRFANDDLEDEPNRLARAPTPYPKELRAMAKHARSIQHGKKMKEIDEDTPLLGEIIAPDPKDILIKEAKVKKPTTVPEQQKISEKQYSSQVQDGMVYSSAPLPSTSSLNARTSVQVTQSSHVIREAKCVRQITSSISEIEASHVRSPKELFLQSGSGLETVSRDLQITQPPSVHSNQAILTDNHANQRLSVASSCDQSMQQPPPYHIAAAYSKQAVWFRQPDIQPKLSTISSVPTVQVQERAKTQHVTQDIHKLQEKIEESTEHTTHLLDIASGGEIDEEFKSNYVENDLENMTHHNHEIEKLAKVEEENVETGNLNKQISHGAISNEHQEVEDIPNNNLIEGRGNVSNSNKQIMEDIPEKDFCDFVPIIKSGRGNVSNSNVQIMEDIPEKDFCDFVPIIKTGRGNVSNSNKQIMEDIPEKDFCDFVPIIKTGRGNVSNSNVQIMEDIPEKDFCDFVPIIKTIHINSGDDGLTTNQNATIVVKNDCTENTKDSAAATITAHARPVLLQLSEVENEKGDVHIIKEESPKGNLSSHRCRIPVSLSTNGDTSLKHEEIKKPPTFTQDKPSTSECIVTPTPHRFASNAAVAVPSTESLETGVFEIKSPELISSPKVQKTSPKTKIPLPTVQGKQESKALYPENNTSPRTRILQPGFYSHISTSYGSPSSKRGSVSSQSSESRPDSIAPLNTSAEFTTNVLEAGHNNCNNPESFSSADNLNYSPKIPSDSCDFETNTRSLNSVDVVDYCQLQLETKHWKEDSLTISKIPMSTSSHVSIPSMKTGSNIPLPIRPLSPPKPGTRNTKAWMFGLHKNATVFPVTIQKSPGLGFSITGGLNSPSSTEKADCPGIYITKIHPNGPASNCLMPGDKILEVDGIDLSKLEHDQAVGILKQTGVVVNMMISRLQ